MSAMNAGEIEEMKKETGREKNGRKYKPWKKKGEKNRDREILFLNIVLAISICTSLVTAGMLWYENSTHSDQLERYRERLTGYWPPIEEGEQITLEEAWNFTTTFDENLTLAQQGKAMGVFDGINPLYLYLLEDVEFVENISSLCSTNSPCSGLNYYTTGKIIMEYDDDLDSMRTVFCHELLHSFFRDTRSNDPFQDPVHAVIYALGIEQVCYYQTGRVFLDERDEFYVSENPKIRYKSETSISYGNLEIISSFCFIYLFIYLNKTIIYYKNKESSSGNGGEGFI